MGKGDNTRPRVTRELDAAALEALTKESKQIPRITAPAEGSTVLTPTHDEPVIALPRTATLDDPFTTGLLAEVARRSQTQEFDDDVIDEVMKSLERPENRHPHIKRRTS